MLKKRFLSEIATFQTFFKSRQSMKKFIIFFLFVNLLINSLSVNSEENFEKFTIGYSVKKHPIELYRFGKGRQLLIIAAGIHGNEGNTSKTAFNLIKYLAEKKMQIDESKSIWIIPELNPDGLAKGRRLNDNDVDLNRNFETDNWKPTVVFFNNILSAGPHPFSEPESSCFRDLIERTKSDYLTVVMSLHSTGNAVIPGDNSKFNKNLLSVINGRTDYLIPEAGYNTTGDLTAWLSSKYKTASLTVEFKTKTETDDDEMLKLINAVLSVDFEKKIYDTGINLTDMFTDNDAKIMNSFTKNLPKNISDSIKAANPKTFIGYFNLCRNQDDLLILVNKTNLLSPNYVPSDIVTLSPKDIPSNKQTFQLRKIVLPELNNMISDAKKDGIMLSIVSAYRSYNTQKSVYNDWKAKLGEKEAARVSAVAGASQHQLGTAIDFNSLNESFENTKEAKWLLENAYKYGFVISFPKNQENITGYKFEPWHYRYIGKDAAFMVYNYFDNSLEIFLNWFWQKNDEK
jgi:zinc D-Ala-D-Ala carboxypeptidase